MEFGASDMSRHKTYISNFNNLCNIEQYVNIHNRGYRWALAQLRVYFLSIETTVFLYIKLCKVVQ